MATRCIDNQTNFELINITTSDSFINDISNKYIKDVNINVQQSVGFSCLLNKISSNLDINTLDTDSLIYYFNVYIELCTICNILPDMTGYSLLINVPYDTMKEWMSGENRSSTHTPLVKKMREFCKLTCVSEAGRGNVGAIYVSKAIHGLTDQPQQTGNVTNNLIINAPLSRNELAAELGGFLSDKTQDIVVDD